MSDFFGWSSGLVATLVPILPVVYALTSGTNRLGRSERLSRLAAMMRPSSERTLIEDIRDQLAADWALSHWAPKLAGRQIAAWTAWVAAGLSFLVFVLFAVTDQTFWRTWSAYGIGLALMIVALLVKASRDRSRAQWIAKERTARWIPLPVGFGSAW